MSFESDENGMRYLIGLSGVWKNAALVSSATEQSMLAGGHQGVSQAI